MKKYVKHYKKIEENQKYFKYLLELLGEEKDIEKANGIAQEALSFATYSNTGYFCSSILENHYLSYAQKIDIENYDINFDQNSFLHVITEGYKTGGHTRVVERWIENSPDNQKHSVVFLNHHQEKITRLEENVHKRNGSCIYFETGLSLKDKALKLRALSLHYQYIVLHIHMDDPTAIVAYGTEKFTRPVMFYNHASHMFWIGKSISDLILDLITNDEISINKKNIKNNFVVGIPTNQKNHHTCNKKRIRERFNIPIDKKIIISSGGNHKYHPICDDDFCENVMKIIDEDTYCYIIGTNPKDKYWKNANKISKGHIVPLAPINFNEGYLDLIASADLYLDSYPSMNGGTAFIDAISCNVPAISLKTAFMQLDYLTTTSAFCTNTDDYVYKAKKILKDKEYAISILEEVKNSLSKYQSLETWNNNIANAIKQLPKFHKIYESKEEDKNEIDDIAVVNNVICNNSFLSNNHTKCIQLENNNFKYGLITKVHGIPFVFQVLTCKIKNKKLKVIKLFNIKIFEYTKENK